MNFDSLYPVNLQTKWWGDSDLYDFSIIYYDALAWCDFFYYCTHFYQNHDCLLKKHTLSLGSFQVSLCYNFLIKNYWMPVRQAAFLILRSNNYILILVTWHTCTADTCHVNRLGIHKTYSLLVIMLHSLYV